MGTWGAALFADDFARDVREAYLDRLAYAALDVTVKRRALTLLRSGGGASQKSFC